MTTRILPSTAGQAPVPDEERREAFVLSYFATGNAMKSGAAVGIHRQTVFKWKNSDWFAKALKDLQRAHDGEMDARISGILTRALEQIEDRLENGDEKILVVKDVGVVIERQKIGAKDLSVVAAVLFDKREKLRKEADPLDSVESGLDKLAAKLREFAVVGKMRTPADTLIEDVVDNGSDLV